MCGDSSRKPGAFTGGSRRVRGGFEEDSMSQGVRTLGLVPEFKVVSDFSAAGDQPRGHRPAGRRRAPGRPLPDAPRHHRLGQERHHRLDHRAGPEADARHRPQQDPGRPAGQRVPRVLPSQPGRVLRQLLRLLPARGLHPLERHLHREGLLDQRRDRAAPALHHAWPCSPGPTSSSSPRCRASTASARPTSTATSSSPCGSGRSTTSARSCGTWSTCATSATT